MNDCSFCLLNDRADMDFIQGHPWMNIPLTLNFPSNVGDEKQAPPLKENQQRRASNPPPSLPKEKTSGYVTGSANTSMTGSSQSGTKNEPLPAPVKDLTTATGAKPPHDQTLHVPAPQPSGNTDIKDSLSASFPAKCGSDRSRSKSLPNGGLELPSPGKTKTITFPDIVDNVSKGRQRSSSVSKGADSPDQSAVDSLSCVSGQSSGEGSKVASRVLNTKNPFHSASRYERRGSNTSDI